MINKDENKFVKRIHQRNTKREELEYASCDVQLFPFEKDQGTSSCIVMVSSSR